MNIDPKHKRKLSYNRNNFQCYHNKRGYCSYGEKCLYQHYKEICQRTLCTEKEYRCRHPVTSKFKDKCKFQKLGICSFKHGLKTNMNDDMKLITEIKTYEDDIENLKPEIIDLKNIIEVKEKELLERIVMK